ncbi:MAG: hypothetical protein H7067_05470 [Burkholderiales bacterium]|nr:hypothetical protein [Opitutaceae bacterium]
MKKIAAKSTAAKTPTPATKAEPVAKSPVKKAVAAVNKAALVAVKPTPKPVAKPAAKPVAKPEPKPVAKAPVAVVKAKEAKAPSPKPKAKGVAVTTTIVAAVDVGFGNSLILRGEGPGLSWESGTPMECMADDRWSITLPESSQPIICKFLINDSTWSAGDDYTVLPGSSVVLSPVF